MSDEAAHDGALADAFAGMRATLGARLGERATVRDAAAALRDVLERLPEVDDPVRAERLRLAGEVLRAAALGALSAVRTPELPKPKPKPRPRQEEPRRSIPLLGSLLGEPRREDERRDPGPREPWRPPPEPIVHTAQLLEQLTGAFEAVDRLLAASEQPPPERVRVPWAEDADLLDLVHDLLAAHHERDGGLAVRQLGRMRDILALQHGIEAVELDEGNGRFFDYAENPDPADPRVTTVRPALMARGRVVRRGEVRGPARTAAALRDASAGGDDTSESGGLHDE